jgi:hypothetical protein
MLSLTANALLRNAGAIGELQTNFVLRPPIHVPYCLVSFAGLPLNMPVDLLPFPDAPVNMPGDLLPFPDAPVPTGVRGTGCTPHQCMGQAPMHMDFADGK